ncbi:MAG: peptide deformylase [Desulfovibrio sp.]|nr:peptide deformylase [Desulfovibrio sp.]
MILDIVSYPDPRLKTVCTPVESVNQGLRLLADNMLETMYAAPGVGLAAPQVGRFIRMVVVDYSSKEEVRMPRVLINPQLELQGELIVSEREGCLSVPMGYRANVQRYSRIHLTARDLDWNLIDEELENFPAIVVQHETDHLDGVLFIDRISRLKRTFFDSKVKKWMRKQKNTA